MYKKHLQKNRGFTLVEMMVSVSIFSIVVMIALGAILTILDANRKARTLTEVMNNLNFSVEMITRSLKTGVEPDLFISGDQEILFVNSIVLDETTGFQREVTRYRLHLDNSDSDNPIGEIQQCVSATEGPSCSVNEWVAITSELVDIDRFDVTGTVWGDEIDLIQPRVQIVIAGTVKVSESISSEFSLQTTVSQRRLNIEGSEMEIPQ